MNPGQLIDALHAAGGTLVVEHGQARLRGAAIPEELKAALKQHKAAVLAEWEKRQTAHRDRYAVVPDGEAPHASRELRRITDAQRVAVSGYVIRQPHPVHAWHAWRANEYHSQGATALGEADWRAAVDVLCWQRCTERATEALDWLAGLETAATEFNKPQSHGDTEKKP